MDIVVSPQTVSFTTQFGAPAPSLTPGDVVEAQVLQILADGRARLAVANAVIDVQTQVPLTVGTTVRLAVKNTPDGIRLTLIEPNGVRSPVTPATDIATAARPALASDSAALRTPPAVATAAAPTAPAATSVSISGVAAAANFAASHPAVAATPGPSANAGTASSGVAGASAPASLLEAQAVAQPPSPDAASAAALATAVRGAAARQISLAPLFADLAVAARLPDLPEAVRQAAGQVLTLRTPLQDGLSAVALKQAFQRSGVFLESRLAAETGAVLPADDLKAALGVLRGVLKAWLDGEPPVRPAANGQLPDLSHAPPPVPGRGPGAPVPGQAPQAPAAAAPPPYRGAPTVAQPEPVPLLSPATPPEDAGRVLLRETEGALARQTLLQAASLPEAASRTHDTPGPRWHFEIPFATGQGTTVAQFEIARDGRAAPQDGAKAVWRARFSIDVEPIGPVHAQVALIGERAAVTLWAERPEAAARLRDNAAALGDALREAALEPDVLVRAGAPPRPREAAAPAGRFLDRAT